ncbi:MAG: hypothetical protein K2P78_06105 [Gemmataceae bacterium]|nr:hypothetical protein [Gemmataceae bacterium]
MALGDQVEALRQQVAKLEIAVALFTREAGVTAGELSGVFDTARDHTTEIAVLKAGLAEARREIDELKRERDKLRDRFWGLVAAIIVVGIGAVTSWLRPR